MRDDLIEAAKSYVRILFGNNSGGHDVNHTMRVYRNAVHLAEKEQRGDLTVIKLAALLHDAEERHAYLLGFVKKLEEEITS